MFSIFFLANNSESRHYEIAMTERTFKPKTMGRKMDKPKILIHVMQTGPLPNEQY